MMRLRKPPRLQRLKLKPHGAEPIFQHIGVNPMNSGGQVRDDEVQGCDVIARGLGRRGHVVVHFSSPVLSNSRTVEATGGGVNPSPRASAGVLPITGGPDAFA